MSNALSIAVGGINTAINAAVRSTTNIVNGSSTGKNIDGDLINIQTDATDVAANAAVIKISEKANKALLDIKV